nr:flagellar biosynthesis protein FliQ [uncultured Acetatifactor sp.]
MTVDAVMDITKQALFLIIKVSLPMLLVSLCVGLVVSIFQTVTSIQEQTLTFVPKIICVFLSMILFGNWMMTAILEFMTELWMNFGLYAGG